MSPKQLTTRIKACMHVRELDELLQQQGHTFNEVWSSFTCAAEPSLCIT